MGLIAVALAGATLLACDSPTRFRVPRGGMEPTINIGQSIELDPDAYRNVADVRRGDVIVFRAPGIERPFVKRVLGLPGERVRVEEGRVAINGVPVPLAVHGDVATESGYGESYRVLVKSPCTGKSDVAIPAGAFFVLGDNRCASRDSRDFGAVPFSTIQGKVVLRE